jgi:hypothetical protein
MKRWLTTALALSAFVLTGVLGVGADAASAEVSCSSCRPWWHLTSGSRPSYLHHKAGSGKGQSAVFELIVEHGKAGNIVLEDPENHVRTFFAYNAPASVVQEKLEARVGKVVYGAGNVEVSGGPVGEPLEVTRAEYTITFKGGKAERPVELLYSAEFSEEFVNEGGRAEIATVTMGKLGNPDGVIVDTAVNVGDGSTSGTVKLTDELPAGLKAISAEVVKFYGTGQFNSGECSLEPTPSPEHPTPVCTYNLEPTAPFEQLELRVGVIIETSTPEASVSEGELNGFTVSGGEAADASVHRPLKLSDEATPFGAEYYEMSIEEEGGATTEQAGSHPFQTSFTIGLNQGQQSLNRNGFAVASPVALTKDVNVDLPPGLIGNPEPFPRCSLADFFQRPNPTCKPESVMGVAVTTVNEGGQVGLTTLAAPIYNLEPQAGEPARFGFLPLGAAAPVYIDSSVRTGSDYGISTQVKNITQEAGFLSSTVTFWGVPGAASHDLARGYSCLVAGRKQSFEGPCEALRESAPPPFWLAPARCGQSLPSSLSVDSWDSPGSFVSLNSELVPALSGCNRLPFEPAIKVSPDGSSASTATGLTVDVHVPQEESLNATGLTVAEPRKIVVRLPEGVAINPSDANGLESCSPGLIGYLGRQTAPLLPDVTVSAFTPRIPGSIPSRQVGEDAPFEPGLNFCANASKIGTVRIRTPLLEHELEGAVYLGAQEDNPFGTLVAIYLVAEDPVSGSLVKLPGEIKLDPSTGQIETTFEDNPQVPFEDAELHFFGGERAPLSTPSRCGSYTTTASFVPWGANPSSEAAETVRSAASFDITSGPNGSPCTGPGQALPFAPSLAAGTTSNQAGGFSPFSMTMSRPDGQQNLSSIELVMPPGLTGSLTGVELCSEPQANLGRCGPKSLIGETTVSVGVGSDPFTVSGGKVYLTGPYNGQGDCSVGTLGCAPFGLSIVNPAKAGPFDLEHTRYNQPACDCLVVRAKVEVNPTTAAVSVISDPPGSPHAIPASIEGVPLQIQHVNVVVGTHNDFTFNPTNCDKLEVLGTLHATEGGARTIGVPFQVTNCAALKFEPKVAISTQGKTSRANGASLRYRLTYPKVSAGSDANIHYVKVQLPKQLPSRLPTLQKACIRAQFDRDPAGCPAASVIGRASASVPNIPVPLAGPVYFVSNGGEAFPDLVMVLEGYGVRIDLIGNTHISGSGITSTTFKAIPDNPISSFEIALPEGPYSALAANVNLCKLTKVVTVKKKVTVKVHGRKETVMQKVQNAQTTKLTMPNEFVAQNGAELHENVPIQVTGCSEGRQVKHKPSKRNAKRPKTGGRGQR